MVHWMRKYKKWIFTGIAVVTIPTFVMWGGYAGKSQRNASNAVAATTVATVAGDPILVGELRERLNRETERRTRNGKRPTLQELDADGTVERVLESLIDNRLLGAEVAKRTLSLDRPYLAEQLKKDPAFLDDKGNLNAARWNAWVSEQNQNWNEIYERLEASASQQLMLREITAPARVFDSEVKKEFEANHTSIQVKYVSVEAKVTPTPEQVQALYDKDPKRYEIPEKRNVQFVAVSLAPPRPAELDDIVTRARAGEDFAELAKKYSKGPDAEQGGAMDWRDQSLNDPANLVALYRTPVGQVSDPVEFGGTYYVYKVEEERQNADGLRGVKARQILLQPVLDEAQRKALEDKANAIVASAKKSGLEAAASEAGLAVLTATDVAKTGTPIQGVSMMDSAAFITAVTALPKDAISETIKGRENLYVVKVTDVIPPVPQPLDAVREKVLADATRELTMSPEHADATSELAKKIAEKAKSLQDVITQNPDLTLEIKETKEFTRRDYLFQEGLMADPAKLLETFAGKEPGAFAGPIQGFMGNAYFFELVKRTPPTEENWKTDWPKEEESLRQNALMQHRNALLKDYIASLRDKAAKENLVKRNAKVYNEFVAPPKEETPEETKGDKAAETSAPAESAPAKPAAPAPTAPAESAPAAPAK